MDASLARVDCLVESAPAEEHTAFRGLGYEPCCCSRRNSRGVFTASSYPWSSYYKNLSAAALPGGCGDDGQLRAFFFNQECFLGENLTWCPKLSPTHTDDGQETPAGGSCGLQSRACGVKASGSVRGVDALVRSGAKGGGLGVASVYIDSMSSWPFFSLFDFAYTVSLPLYFARAHARIMRHYMS
jgi:hypothetical protein